MLNALQPMQGIQPMQKKQVLHPRGKMNKPMTFLHIQKTLRKEVLGIKPHRKPKLEDMLPDTEKP